MVSNPGIKDFRDPKVIFYTPGQKWIMAIAAKDKVRLYSSGNLTDWAYESSISIRIPRRKGICECPDLIEQEHPQKKRPVWLLTISYQSDDYKPAQLYLLGDFNGCHFYPFTNWQPVDYGIDFYAAQSWFNYATDEKRKLLIAWCSNYKYTDKTPEKGWRGVMSIPHSLSLKSKNNGVVLVQQPVSEIKKMIDKIIFNGKLSLKPALINTDKALRINLKYNRVTENNCIITIIWDSGDFLSIKTNNKNIIVDRRNAGSMFAAKKSGVFTIPFFQSLDSIELVILLDASLLEIFIEQGEQAMTLRLYPEGIVKELFRCDKSQTTVSATIETFKCIEPIFNR